MTGFSRNEVRELTGLTLSKLNYLERIELVVPNRVVLPGQTRANLFYTWRQLLELRAIAELRESLSLQTVRKVVEFIEACSDDSYLHNKRIAVINGDAYWVEPDFAGIEGILLKLSGKSQGQITFDILRLPDFYTEVCETAEQSNVIDFEDFKQRFKVA